ncbi:hypothetical protein LJC51_08985 [Lachnospiraceae bacterium OttesenSCG-928-J05]|nr:hypothetical protein [Lachnospiraceae bacterium OttesenSCG-928-J05]
MSDYMNLDFIEIQNLDIDIYLYFMREAFIYEQMKTEEGREYLENCWRIKQTKPDRKAIREKLKKRGDS